MNKGVVFAAFLAFVVPIGLVVCTTMMPQSDSEESTTSRARSSGKLLYFYTPS